MNTSNQYLIAFALIEQNGLRAMPLGGKSIKQKIDDPSTEQNDVAGSLAKELLLRVFQRSEDGPIKRAASDQSLLLVQISMEAMYSKIPLLKSKWIESGDTEAFFKHLEDISCDIWKLTFSREEGIQFLNFIG